MPTIADFKKEIKISEGSISHMYLDTVGKVTVGVGNMLPDVSAAKKLPFVDRSTKKKATDAEIEADFSSVKSQTKGLIASSYKKHTKLDLPDMEIDKLLDERIAEFTRQLKLKFPKFDTYPITAQMAMLDMAFNLGVNGLVTKFPSMKKAIDGTDWSTAAKESNRPQVSTARNAVVKKWFDEAAKK
jgi:GH24 family phage-related lysozyme (muramidase)